MHKTAACLSQIALKFGLRQSTSFSPNFSLKWSTPCWFECQRHSMANCSRMLFWMVQSLTPYDLPFPQKRKGKEEIKNSGYWATISSGDGYEVHLVEASFALRCAVQTGEVFSTCCNGGSSCGTLLTLLSKCPEYTNQLSAVNIEAVQTVAEVHSVQNEKPRPCNHFFQRSSETMTSFPVTTLYSKLPCHHTGWLLINHWDMDH